MLSSHDTQFQPTSCVSWQKTQGMPSKECPPRNALIIGHNALTQCPHNQPRRAIPTIKLRVVAESARNDLIIGHDAQFSEQICVSCKYKYKKTKNALTAASAPVFPSLVWSVTALPRHQGTMKRDQGTIQRLYSRNSPDRTTSDQITR